jgi:hypothetical protein
MPGYKLWRLTFSYLPRSFYTFPCKLCGGLGARSEVRGAIAGEDDIKHVVVVTMILVVVAGTRAEAGPIRAGVSVGGSSVTQSYDYSPEIGQIWEGPDRRLTRVGFGGFTELALDDRFSLGLDVIYVQKGLKDDFAVTNPDSPEVIGTRTVTAVMRYLSVPATVSVGYPVGEVTPYVFAGPSLEFLLSHDKGTAFSDAFENMDTVAFGLHVGAGAHWRRWGVNIRYFTDLANSYEPPGRMLLESVKNYGWLGMVSFAVLQ